MFSAALAGGATPPQTPPLLSWFSFFLERSSANFVKKIQKLAEDKAENPRTCRGQSREKKSVRTPPRKLKSQSFALLYFFALPQRSGLRKRWAAVLPPRGGFNPPPTGNGVSNHAIKVSASLSGFFFSEVLSPPPKSSPTGSGPTPSAAAICGAGASWRLLGRKNRVPRGLQKLIKF